MRRILTSISIIGLCLIVFAGFAEGRIRIEDEEIIFGLTAPGAERVYVVGDFNGWNPTIDRLIEVEGLFEIRLYLVPGRYRYRFIVDGDSISDPDNPAVDAEGNSVFHLVESATGLSITMGEAAIKTTGVVEEVSFEAELGAIAGAYRDAVNAAFRLEGSSGDRIEARFAVGYEVTIRDDEMRRGEVLFTRATGIYNFKKGRLEAFTREADLDFHDPVSLFGPSGIYRYPLGSLCRGLLYEGRLPLGIEGKAFYANRLEGPADGFESTWEPSVSSFFSAREITDSDIIGLRLGSKLWRTRFAYLMRRDRRPFPYAWSGGDNLPYVSFRGYERVLVDGFLLSIEGEGPMTFEFELLEGESRLSSTEIDSSGEAGSAPYEAEWEQQNGLRFHSGVRYGGDRLGFALSIDQTLLSGYPGMDEGDSRFREQAVVRGAADMRFPFGYIGARGRVERRSSGSGGNLFWLRRRNFFLDGDEISTGRLPFMGSDDLYELEILFVQPMGAEWAPQPITESRGMEDHFEPFALPLVLSFVERWDRGNDRVSEMRFSKGAELHRLIRLFVDARYVSYDIEGWSGENDFLDLFVALRGRIGDDSWVSLGLGVNPTSYDGWLYRRTGCGRERYLVERGLLEAGISREELLGALEETERALSEEWSISFEAFIRFW